MLIFFDDMTLAESIPLRSSLEFNQNRPLPDHFHSRTGHNLIPEKSSVFKEIKNIQ